LALILLRGAPLERRESPLVRWLQRHYEAALSRILAGARWVFLATGVTVAAGLASYPLLGHSLLPDFKERDFLMHWLTKPGTSHPEMYRVTVQASKELRTIPGVRNFGAHIGRALQADEVVGIYFTENWVSVDPKVDYDKTLHAIEEAVAGYPGLYRDVQTYLKERIREVLTGSGEALIVRIFGPDLGVLREQARIIADSFDGIPGLIDLHVEAQADVPLIQVKVDLAKAAAHGLKPGDVQRAAATIMAGREVSDLHYGGKVYDVVVWSLPEHRHSLNSVQELLLDTPSGRYVRLADVADVSMVPSPNFIRREQGSRRIDVQANVRGRDLSDVAYDVEQRLQTIELPLGYHAELLGEYAERQAAQKALGLGLAGAGRSDWAVADKTVTVGLSHGYYHADLRLGLAGVPGRPLYPLQAPARRNSDLLQRGARVVGANALQRHGWRAP
jgi:Cu/Ag efflux pump CusA